jgi:hypothetical protein
LKSIPEYLIPGRIIARRTPFLNKKNEKCKKWKKFSFFPVFPAQQKSWTGLIEVGTFGEFNLFDIAEVFFLAKNLLS